MNALLALTAAAALTTIEIIPHPPKPVDGPGSWISSSDYPDAALHDTIVGAVGVELSVDDIGAVERCRVTTSSGSSLLDGTTCGLLTARAKFTPATDSSGRFVPGTFNSRVFWQIPHTKRTAIQNIEPFAFTIRFDLTRNGDVEHCKVLTHTGAADASANACRAYSEGAQVAPFRDETGRLVPKIVTYSSELNVRDP